jgi:hypothetical protein
LNGKMVRLFEVRSFELGWKNTILFSKFRRSFERVPTSCGRFDLHSLFSMELLEFIDGGRSQFEAQWRKHVLLSSKVRSGVMRFYDKLRYVFERNVLTSNNGWRQFEGFEMFVLKWMVVRSV